LPTELVRDAQKPPVQYFEAFWTSKVVLLSIGSNSNEVGAGGGELMNRSVGPDRLVFHGLGRNHRTNVRGA